jgi:hypothetical protein
VGFSDLFVKLTLQTNQKLGLKSLQWVLLIITILSLLFKQLYFLFPPFSFFLFLFLSPFFFLQPLFVFLPLLASSPSKTVESKAARGRVAPSPSKSKAVRRNRSIRLPSSAITVGVEVHFFLRHVRTRVVGDSGN